MSACFPPGAIESSQISHNIRMAAAIALLSFTVVPIGAQPSNQTPPDEARDHAALGISLAKQRRLSEAEEQLREAVRLEPGVAAYRAQFGSVLGLEGKWQEAVESFEKAVEQDPANLDFRREAAAVQYQLHRVDAAEKNIRYVLVRRPDDPGANLLLGLVSEEKGEHAAAVRLLTSQFDLVLSQPDRTVVLCRSIYRSGEHADLPRLVSALKLRASDRAWASAIGRCAEIAAKNHDGETSDLLDSLLVASEPTNQSTDLERAATLYKAGKVAEAQQLLLQLAGSKPGDDNVQALLGRCYESLHQRDLALRAYHRALDLAPTRVEHYEDLISLQLDLGLTGDAQSLANRLSALAPNDARSWLAKGNIELRTNDFQDALKSYAYAGGLDAHNADALLGRAAVNSVLGLNDAAINDYKTGLDRFSNDARFNIGYAAMLLASPDATQAYPRVESLLRQAVKLDPNSPDAHYQLGQVALRQGKLEEAKSEFLSSLEADPDRSTTHFALSLVYRRMGQAPDAAKQFAIYEQLKQTEEHATAMSDQPAGKP